MLNLEAATSNEKIILDYLNKNASEILVEKINNGKKTLTQCWSYIVAEAKKLAQNGCACVEDSTVFGWAIHFFEEDSIEGKIYNTKASAVKTAKTDEVQKKKERLKTKREPEQFAQLSFFGM